MQWKKMLKAGAKYISNSDYRFLINAGFGKCDSMNDEDYLKKKYSIIMGKELNLDNPQTFNEKLQWLKLYDRKPEYTMMVDKIEVRKYIAETIGEEYLIPCLETWDRAKDINFDDLPNQFVLKCNHNSGTGMCICKDKTKIDFKKVQNGLDKGLRENFYLHAREWPYKNVKRRIIAEQFMGNNLIDYKFYCFNGEPKFLYVALANITDGKKDDLLSFYTLDWKPAPFYRKDHKPFPYKINKPDSLDEMLNIARILSEDIPFVRVDLYEVEGKIFFSELTFSPGGGFGQFYPQIWEEKIGGWLELPGRKE
ncbi:TupA-like ATPgrasp [Eubacterium aggregans]|uniref:TupA-like ATPgrasp n=1 Tax=Eubacterium aggregans TaxID=81409 RepID=A0A1H3YB21_9FIRM|nr:ATP-grasp fold amidoligase family protein [Eubacterium aggregans]SEA08164.1 TupA-like ATPgrasp [Eubacterium aggregans]